MTDTRASRLLHRTGRAALAVTAVLGAVCVLLTVLSLVSGVRPVVFRSGSMSPEVPAGSLGFSSAIAGEDIAIGDVVTVTTSAGVRVTHRVVDVTHHDKVATLRLKGDANATADEELYRVTSARELRFSIPEAGYVVSWLSRSPGSYALAVYVGLMLYLLTRGRKAGPQEPAAEAELPAEPAVAFPVARPVPSVARVADDAATAPAPESTRAKGKRLVVAGAALAVVAVAVAGWGQSTSAAWNDDASVSGTVLSTGTFDTQAPTTTASTSPAANANGWNNTNVMVTFSPTDPAFSSGIQKVEYRTTSNGGATSAFTSLPTTPYTALLSVEGTTKVEFRATDNAGNVEAIKTLVPDVKIDKTAPLAGTLTLGQPTANAAGWRTSGAFTLGGSDTGANASGVDFYQYKIDSGAYQNGSTGTIPDGTHTVTSRTVDKAGNQGAETTTAQIKVDSVKPTATLTAPSTNNNFNNSNQWGTRCTNATGNAVAGWCGGSSDATSLVASVTYEIKKVSGSTTTCWDGSTFLASACGTMRATTAGSSATWYVPMAYGSIGSFSSITITYVVTDNAGNSDTFTRTFN